MIGLVDGTVGSTTKVASGNGVAANALRVTLASDSTGTVVVTDGGTTVSVDDGGGSITVDGTVTVNIAPATSGGLTIGRVISAASTNGTSVKGSAGQLYGYSFTNTNASFRYLKLYNKASSPSVGSDTPVITIGMPGAMTGHVEYSNGIAFGTGIALALTTGLTDADTGAVAANEIVVNLFYK